MKVSLREVPSIIVDGTLSFSLQFSDKGMGVDPNLGSILFTTTNYAADELTLTSSLKGAADERISAGKHLLADERFSAIRCSSAQEHQGQVAMRHSTISDET